MMKEYMSNSCCQAFHTVCIVHKHIYIQQAFTSMVRIRKKDCCCWQVNNMCTFAIEREIERERERGGGEQANYKNELMVNAMYILRFP